MTALEQYQRLESPAIWHPSPQAQRRDVILSFGDATLVIADLRGRALAHWSLPAVERVNPGETPALFRPGPDAEEMVEIDDEAMIDALMKVRRAIERRRPHPGRLRHVLTAAAVAVVAGLMVFWLPRAMIDYTAAVVPPQKRAAIGESLLESIRRISGKTCETALGRQALTRLHERLLPGQAGRIVVLSGGMPKAEHLPGGIILLNRALVEDYDDPAVVAGFVLAEDQRARNEDPMVRLLRTAGLVTSFRLLTTGEIPDSTLKGYAEALMVAQPAPVDQEILAMRFAEAGVPASPYAYALDITGETTLALIEADQLNPAEGRPVLNKTDWASLQAICGG